MLTTAALLVLAVVSVLAWSCCILAKRADEALLEDPPTGHRRRPLAS